MDCSHLMNSNRLIDSNCLTDSRHPMNSSSCTPNSSTDSHHMLNSTVNNLLLSNHQTRLNFGQLLLLYNQHNQFNHLFNLKCSQLAQLQPRLLNYLLLLVPNNLYQLLLLLAPKQLLQTQCLQLQLQVLNLHKRILDRVAKPM